MAKRGKFEQPRVKTAVKKKKSPARWIVPAVLVVLILTVALVGAKLKNGKTIYPNVRVAGVEVGGLTASEAQELVEQTVADSYHSQTLEVDLPDRTLAFEPEQTNVVVDAEQAIENAMNYGREGNVFAALIRYLSAGRNIHEMNLETALELDTAYLESLIYQTAADVKTAPVNASMAMDAQMTKVTVQVGTAGRELDAKGLYEAVYTAFQQGDFTPLTWQYDKIPYENVDLAALHEKLAAAVADAYYDKEKRQIIDGVDGRTFDLEEAEQRLAAAADGTTLEIPLEVLEPTLTTGKLTYQMFGEILEQRSSVYVVNPKRTENLRLACEAINGTIINPGEVFSFNDTVGERTEEKGYQPATIYGGEGESVDGVGGGVCQVASTIYYAALYMDLPTVMREPHMYLVTYVPAGCDATIFWDSGLDYKFRNNRENPIKIQANINDGKVNITFWGVKESDNYVELSKPVTLETWTDEDVEEVDETKPVGYREQKQTSYTGSKVVVTKKVFDGDGKLLREEELESTYKSRPNIYIVGPSEELPPEDLENPEGTENTEDFEEFMPEDTEESLWTEEGV